MANTTTSLNQIFAKMRNIFPVLTLNPFQTTQGKYNILLSKWKAVENAPGALNYYCEIHFAPLGHDGHQFVGIHRRIIIPGFLGWCHEDFETIPSRPGPMVTDQANDPSSSPSSLVTLSPTDRRSLQEEIYLSGTLLQMPC